MEENSNENKQIKGQSIGKGFVILSAATVAVKMMSLIFVPVMSALLGGDVGYSAFGATNEVYAFIYVIATAGIPVAVSKLVTELTAVENPVARENAFKTARKIAIFLGLFFMVLMMSLARVISKAIGYEEIYFGILAIAPTVFVCAILSVYRGYFQGRKNMTPTAISQVAEQITHVVASILLVAILRKYGIEMAVAGASLGTTMGSLVALLIVYYYYRKSRLEVKDEIISASNSALKPVTTKEIIRKIIAYGVPITLSSGIQYGGNIIDVSILKNRLVAGGIDETTAKALYGSLIKARQLLNVPNALVTALCVSILPAIAGAFAVNNRKDAGEKANYGFKLCFLASIPVAFAFAVFSKPIYEILRFNTNYKILSFMAFSVVLTGVVHLQSSVLNSINKLYTATINLGIGIALKAILNYILVAIPGLNIYGAIISTYVSYLVPLTLNTMVIRRTLGKNVRILPEIKAPFVCSAVMIEIAFAVYKILRLVLDAVLGERMLFVRLLLSFGPAALAGVYVYVFIMGYVGGLTREDVASVSRKLLRFLPKTVKNADKNQ